MIQDCMSHTDLIRVIFLGGPSVGRGTLMILQISVNTHQFKQKSFLFAHIINHPIIVFQQFFNKRPIVFIHGTADAVIGDTWMNNGFRHSIEYLIREKGYTKAELYGSTWGWADYFHEFQHVYQEEYIIFIEAVIEYTGAEQVDVIAHSMGVPLTRRALKGGISYIHLWEEGHFLTTFYKNHTFDIGDPLTLRVKHFIGIVGPNYGVRNCSVNETFHQIYRGCDKFRGFYPGTHSNKKLPPEDLSYWLKDMHLDPTREAEHTYAIVSLGDETIPAFTFPDQNRLTGEFPTADRTFMFTQYSHREARDKTKELQYEIVSGLYDLSSQIEE